MTIFPAALWRSLALWPCLSFFLSLAPPSIAAQSTGSVAGTIRYDDSGKPAADVNMWLTPSVEPPAPQPDPATGEYIVRDPANARRWLAKVGADGGFTIHEVPAGSYLVHTYAPHYLSPDGTVYPTSNMSHIAMAAQPGPDALRVEVTAGIESRLDVRLRRGGSIEGTVRNSDGTQIVSDAAPLSGIAVNAEQKLGPGRYARSGGAAHTDAKGHYEIDSLPPGDYIVFAAARGAMVPMIGGGSRASSGLPVYAPQTVQPGAATPIHITGAESHTLDLSLFSARDLHRLEGAVPWNDVTILKTALVRLYPKDEGGLTASTSLTVAGSFSFSDVPDGQYTVSVEFPPTQEFVGITPDKTGVRMRLRKAALAPTTMDVIVHGQDVAGLLIHPTPTTQ